MKIHRIASRIDTISSFIAKVIMNWTKTNETSEINFSFYLSDIFRDLPEYFYDQSSGDIVSKVIVQSRDSDKENTHVSGMVPGRLHHCLWQRGSRAGTLHRGFR